MMPYSVTPEALAERFWRRVNKNGPMHPVLLSMCWLWTGAVFQRSNYGSVTSNGIQKSAHRAAWEFCRGPIPNGLFVLHRCDTRLCVNVDEHLRLGTHQDNMDDARAKGRLFRPVGELGPNAKFTWEIVREIRKKYATGEFSYLDLASEYGGGYQNIAHIINNRSWKET